ncbi:MAG: hypothetical protein ACE5FU_04885 [Nitrospinota bacterium]
MYSFKWSAVDSIISFSLNSYHGKSLTTEKEEELSANAQNCVSHDSPLAVT